MKTTNRYSSIMNVKLQPTRKNYYIAPEVIKKNRKQSPVLVERVKLSNVADVFSRILKEGYRSSMLTLKKIQSDPVVITIKRFRNKKHKLEV